MRNAGPRTSSSDGLCSDGGWLVAVAVVGTNFYVLFEKISLLLYFSLAVAVTPINLLLAKVLFAVEKRKRARRRCFSSVEASLRAV